MELYTTIVSNVTIEKYVEEIMGIESNNWVAFTKEHSIFLPIVLESKRLFIFFIYTFERYFFDSFNFV